MSHLLFTQGANNAVRNLINQPFNPDRSQAQIILDAIGQHGLGVRLSQSAEVLQQTDTDDAFAAIGGAETSGNLSQLSNNFSYLSNLAEVLNQALFRDRLAPYVQIDNRSVSAAFSRQSNNTIDAMVSFLIQFLHKDIKHPVRTLSNMSTRNNSVISFGRYNHVRDSELTYTEEETGTYHTLLNMGDGAGLTPTWSVYLEDTPLVRRYIRYVDHIASQHGIRLVYCPKTFAHREEMDAVARPTWEVVDERVIRQFRGPNNYRALFVSLSFSYAMFSPLTRVETEVQPNQRLRGADEMQYTPVMVEYTDAFVQVIKQLGAFSVCKIYYKASRTPARL